MNKLFTIGYSPHTLESFLDAINKHHITAITDVRSTPYSQYKPEFNRDKIKDFLKKNNIAYVFLGDLCGARVEDPSCYIDGKVNYSLVANNSKFKEGLVRIQKGLQSYRIALMCAEKDPITCHRTILICRNLVSMNIQIEHILENGEIERHKESELRLMKLFNLNHPDLFQSEKQRLDEAYSRQGEKIAYEIIDATNELKGL